MTFQVVTSQPGYLFFENEDVEGLLDDLGIGYHDRNGNYQEGISPEEIETGDMESVLAGIPQDSKE